MCRSCRKCRKNKMVALFGFRINIKRCIIPFVCIFVCIYSLVHSVSGNRGWLRLQEIERQNAEITALYAELENQKLRLEEHISALGNQKLDTDFLDEKVRRHLDMTAPKEYIIFD